MNNPLEHLIEKRDEISVQIERVYLMDIVKIDNSIGYNNFAKQIDEYRLEKKQWLDKLIDFRNEYNVTIDVLHEFINTNKQ